MEVEQMITWAATALLIVVAVRAIIEIAQFISMIRRQ